jgi:hypothetical protein
MVETLKISFMDFPELWLLLLVSLVSGLKGISTPKFTLNDLIGLLGFYGVFAYLIWLFSIGLQSWNQIITESPLNPPAYFVLRALALTVGYSLTRRYLQNKPEYKMEKMRKKPMFRFFIEFISVCGSIAAYLILIGLIILFKSF